MDERTLEERISRLCDAVMRGFVAALPKEHSVDHEVAVQEIRATMKAFFFSAEWENERQCVLNRSLHENVILARLVSESLVNYLDRVKAVAVTA